jgi:hypothetical protein
VSSFVSAGWRFESDGKFEIVMREGRLVNGRVSVTSPHVSLAEFAQKLFDPHRVMRPFGVDQVGGWRDLPIW